MLPAEKDHPTLETVQELFDGWRKEKSLRDPVPPALWEAALSLTGTHSIYRIAKCLRLNYHNFKARTAAHASVARRSEGGPAFIELRPVVAIECTIEMTKPTGERMTIRGNCSVTELVKEFFR